MIKLPTFPAEPHRILYHEGTLYIPYRVTRDGRPSWTNPDDRHRRLMVDWNAAFDAPRRLHYFGPKYTLIMALSPDGRLQQYSWLKRRWTMKLRWVVLHPSRK